MNANDAALSPFGVRTNGPTIDDLPAQAQAFLREHGHIRVYKRGEFVQRYGEPLLGASWLLQGRLLTVVYHPDGSEQNRGWVMPQELFGLFNLLLSDCPALNNLMVDTDEAHVLYFSRDVLIDMMRRDPEARWGVLTALSRRIAQLFDVIDINGPALLEDKLRTVLLWWARQHGAPARDGSVELWVTQNDLANGVGASRQRVQMELKAMRDLGELDVAYRKIVLRPLFFEKYKQPLADGR